MSITAQAIVDRASTTLLDDTNVRWSEAELLDYLNAGVSAIIMYKPDAASVRIAHSLTVGESAQEIPTDGEQLIEVTRVIGGSAIRQVEANHLDRSRPNWREVEGVPANYVHDKRLPKTFWVTPKPTVATQVELMYVKSLARLNLADQIPFTNVYENPLYWYVLGMAYSKNATRGDQAKSNSYMSMFSTSIGAKTQVQVAMSPSPSDRTTGTNR